MGVEWVRLFLLQANQSANGPLGKGKRKILHRSSDEKQIPEGFGEKGSTRESGSEGDIASLASHFNELAMTLEDGGRRQGPEGWEGEDRGKRW